MTAFHKRLFVLGAPHGADLLCEALQGVGIEVVRLPLPDDPGAFVDQLDTCRGAGRALWLAAPQPWLRALPHAERNSLTPQFDLLLLDEQGHIEGHHLLASGVEHALVRSAVDVKDSSVGILGDSPHNGALLLAAQRAGAAEVVLFSQSEDEHARCMALALDAGLAVARSDVHVESLRAALVGEGARRGDVPLTAADVLSLNAFGPTCVCTTARNATDLRNGVLQAGHLYIDGASVLAFCGRRLLRVAHGSPVDDHVVRSFTQTLGRRLLSRS